MTKVDSYTAGILGGMAMDLDGTSLTGGGKGENRRRSWLNRLVSLFQSIDWNAFEESYLGMFVQYT